MRGAVCVLLGAAVLTAACGDDTVRRTTGVRAASGEGLAPAAPTLLVTSGRPIAAAALERVRALPEVEAVAVIGFAQADVYDLKLALASVDPETFRRFTPPSVRTAEHVWRALAAGGALVSNDVGNRAHLPIEGLVPVSGVPTRVAGFATTVPGLDMVVTEGAGRRLGLVPGNALVVRAPAKGARFDRKLRRILGPEPKLAPIAPAAQPTAVLPPIR